jgi:predicted DNA binding CopG/RHH family protein
MNKRKKVPNFNNFEEEAEFWSAHDSTDYIDWSEAEPIVFPNLKPSTTAISLRLPLWLLARLKELANKGDIPYQSLIKIYLSERVEKELVKSHVAGGTLTSASAVAPETLDRESKSWLTGEVDEVRNKRLEAFSNNNVSSNKEVAITWRNTSGR